jgi:hypothetical protein
MWCVFRPLDLLGRYQVISDDPQIAVVLQTVADRIRLRGYEPLAFKIENLLDLHREELEEELKRKPRK